MKIEKITSKALLILLLIDAKPTMNIKRLVMLFDKADFPSEVGQSLKTLQDNNLITVGKLLENNTPLEYQSTESGKLFLKNNFDKVSTIAYIGRMNNPSHLLEIVNAVIVNITL